MNRSERRAARKVSRGHAAEILAAAIRSHQAGAAVEAERRYRELLAIDPNHPAALHNLGILAIQTGRNELAVDLIGRAIALNRQNPDSHYNRGVALEALGRADDAIVHYREAVALRPDHAEAHLNLGNALNRRGQPDEALACYERALALRPESAGAHYNIANVLAMRGELGEATAHYRKAIALAPDFVPARNNLGNALKDAGFLEEAEAEYLQALALQPDFADAHNNVGTLMAARGALEPAVGHYRQALQAKPDFIDAHANLGLALFGLGRAEEAIPHFETAIRLKPDDLEPRFNLARQLFAAGDVARAVAAAAQALDVKATADARELFARYLGALPEAALAEPYRARIGEALREGWTRTGELDDIAIALIKRDTGIADALARTAEDPGRAELEPQTLQSVAQEPLLHDLMISAPVRDRELERLLTIARTSLREAACDERVGIAPGMLDFACALARQCFINEYVFAFDGNEVAAAGRIAGAIADRVATRADCPAAWLAVAGMYQPLHALPQAAQLLDRTWPAPVTALLDQQVREPREEQAIRASLPELTPIDDDTSRLVQAQYEENPYPRWIAPAPTTQAYPLDRYVRMKFPRVRLAAPLRPGPSDILIAGCGTGAHAIETCRRIAGARILAIDLSAASLAYAARKTHALGLDIEYVQADIMRLGGLGRAFDLVEASGVLHHLADPMAGWRILLSLLKPGGIMSVGLYSRLARTDINAARAFIAERGYRAAAEDIRRCRQEIFSLAPGAPAHRVTGSGDFYSVSGCRDLLFHVQEHQHTLPEIAAFLAEQDLQFLGFEIDPRVLAAYAERNPGDPAMTDLTRWHRFETDHPYVFAAMYQFAVQKR